MNALYTAARQKFLTGQIDWTAGPWRAHLVTAGYVFSPAHTLFSIAVPPEAYPVASTTVLGGLSAVDGAASSFPVAFPRVSAPPADPYTAVILSSDLDGSLLAYIDEGFGLPYAGIANGVVVNPTIFGGYFRL